MKIRANLNYMGCSFESLEDFKTFLIIKDENWRNFDCHFLALLETFQISLPSKITVSQSQN